MIKLKNRRRNMKIEKWTLGLAAAGLVTLSPALLAQTPPAAPQQVPMLTALSATTISGYVDTSAVWNPGTGNANPAPYAFNAGKQDGFNLNAVDVKISKPQDESGWSAGYTAELSYGPDAKLIDGPNTYPVRQAFVALHMPVGNGIDWQLGRFDNLLGYESSDSYKNPNYTRSYGYSVEPTEHTGLLGTYKFCDAISLQLGVANSVTTYDANTRIGVESKKGYLSLLTLTAPDSWGFLKGSALYAGFDLGQGATPMAGGNRVYNKSEWYVGTTINTPLKDLTFGASFDSIEHLDVNGQDTGYFAAYAGYMSYKLTDKLTINGRVEYANGSGLGAMADAANGTTISSVNPTPPPATLSTAFNNPMQSVLGLTGTLQYDLWANVITRLEIRWDHDASGREAVDGSSAAFGGTGALGAALPDKKNEVMIAANVIYKF
jgi:hypothetical protein